MIPLTGTMVIFLPSKLKGSYEQFYFGIANEIGNNYYDPLLMPALKDSASGAAWYWASDNIIAVF